MSSLICDNSFLHISILIPWKQELRTHHANQFDAYTRRTSKTYSYSREEKGATFYHGDIQEAYSSVISAALTIENLKLLLMWTRLILLDCEW